MSSNSSERRECAKACATCPFLRANHGKPNPEGYDPKRASKEHGHQFHDWYSTKNLARLWNGGLKRGEGMVCHATDPGAHEYGGKSAPPGNERLCVGALAVVAKHVMFFKALIEGEPDIKPAESRRRYRAAAGKYPMPPEGLFGWVWQMGLGRTDILGGLSIPESLEAETVESVGVPWNDSIVNQ